MQQKGPAIGGFTSNPHKRFPDVFPEGSFFHTYPYLPPCLFACFVSLSGFIVGIFFLKETRVVQDEGEETHFQRKTKQDEKERESEKVEDGSGGLGDGSGRLGDGSSGLGEVDRSQGESKGEGDSIPLLEKEEDQVVKKRKKESSASGRASLKLIAELLRNKEVMVTSLLYCFLGLNFLSHFFSPLFHFPVFL